VCIKIKRFENQWTSFFKNKLSSEIYYYIVLKMILGTPYSLDSFQTLLNVLQYIKNIVVKIYPKNSTTYVTIYNNGN
jgi:hypothetical protein